MAKFPDTGTGNSCRTIRESRQPEQGFGRKYRHSDVTEHVGGRPFGGDLRDCPTLKWDLASAMRDWLSGLRDSPLSKWDLGFAIRDWLLGLGDEDVGKRDDLRPLWDCGQFAWDVYWPLWVWRSGRT